MKTSIIFSLILTIEQTFNLGAAVYSEYGLDTSGYNYPNIYREEFVFTEKDVTIKIYVEEYYIKNLDLVEEKIQEDLHNLKKQIEQIINN